MLLKWKADYKDQLLASLTAEIPFQSWIELILLFRAKSLKRPWSGTMQITSEFTTRERFNAGVF